MQTIELPTIIDANEIRCLEDEIDRSLLSAAPLTLDASNVEHMEAPALTMLWRAALRYQIAGVDLLFDSPSIYFLNALTDTRDALQASVASLAKY
jgi:hypothetical protein